MKRVLLVLIVLYLAVLGAQSKPIDLFDYPILFSFDETAASENWYNNEEIDIPSFYPSKKLRIKATIPLNIFEEPVLYLSSLYGNFKIYGDGNYLYDSRSRDHQLNHLIKLSSDTREVMLEYEFAIKYYSSPIQLLLLLDSKMIPQILDEQGYDLVIQQLPNVFGFIYLFFSLILLFLTIRISEARTPLLVFTVFTFVEGMVLLLDPLLAFYLEVSPGLFAHLNLSFFGAHNLAVLYICNMVFANGKSKTLRFIFIWQLLFIGFINIWVINHPFNEILEISVGLSFIATFISIIVIMIKNRKQVYPKISFQVGIAYILLPLISAFSDGSELEEVSRFVYLITSALILLIFVYIALEKYKKSQAIAMEKTLTLEQKENQLLSLEKEKLLSQLSVLKNQMNPHFLFNSLSTLTALIDEDQEKAIEYVEELSLVFRYVLQAGKKDLITLAEELEFIKSYSYLLSLKFHHNLTLQYDISQKFLDHRLPPLTLQLMVENVVKHNIIDEESPMQISIYTKGERLLVKNPLQSGEDKLNYRLDSIGIGQQNIQKLFDFYMKEKIKFKIEENHYIVEIPLLAE